MALCYKCGEPLTFFHDGFRAIPVHPSGSCSGAGYGGQSQVAVRFTSGGTYFEFPFTTWPSYVDPNARCPVCGASVFFYQSPDGGRVFFDELGPPWPKHPCTDNPMVRQHLSTREGRTKVLYLEKQDVATKRTLAWLQNGWMPLVLTKIVPCPIGFIADGILFTAEEPGGLPFRISQDSSTVIYNRRRGEVEFGYLFIENVGTFLSVLEEAPVMLRCLPDLHNLLLSSFILTEENEVEEVNVPVVGTRL